MPGVLKVTAPVEFEPEVVDGVVFTLVSGPDRFTFEISRHKARNAMHITERLLDDAERKNCAVAKLCKCGCAAHN